MGEGDAIQSVERDRRQSEFSLPKALFEIAIVTIGVLLALLVDEARQSRADHGLAEQSRKAMQAEIDQNRIRLASGAGSRASSRGGACLRRGFRGPRRGA